jgi:tripartite-type tricarboxylate transporter receptor subunit TctC
MAPAREFVCGNHRRFPCSTSRGAPDGYTILLAGNFSHAINPWLYKNLSWDPHRDFTPITEAALMSIIVCVTPQRQIHSMKELIAKVKSGPGKWFYYNMNPGIAATSG